MATVKKVSKAKNISAGPSKKQPIAPKVDPQGQYTKVQERTLGNMKKGGKVEKAKDGKWIQKAVKTMRTDKPCTGPKFGSKTCPPGSKRYNLAKTFKKMSKKK